MYLGHPMPNSSGYTSSGKDKICKNKQTVKANCKKKKKKKKAFLPTWEFITGADLSVRVTAPYAA